MRKLKALTRKKVSGGSASEQLPHQNIDAACPSPQSNVANPAILPARPLPPTSSSGSPSQAQAVAPTPTSPPHDSLDQAINGPTSTAYDASQVAVRREGAEAGSRASKKDYWKLAIEKLQEEDPSSTILIDAVWQAAGTTGSGDLATHLCDAIKQSQEALEARRWRLTIASKEVVVREQYERLAKGLLLFKDALNVAAGLDPLHAGIPVAGFCVLIEMTVADSEQYAAMVKGVDEVVALIPRYQEIERLYRSRSETKLKAEFEKQLVNLCKDIIRYQVSAAMYYRRNFMRRFLRSIPKLDDPSDLLTAIRDADTKCKDIGQVFNSSDALERHQQLLGKLEKLKTQPASHDNAESYPVHWTVGRSTNSMFTGRNDTLNDLTALIQTALDKPTPQRPARIVITGMGGLGKSELCLQLADKVRSMFWGVFWVDVSTEALARADFLHIANLLHVQAQTWKDACRALSTVQKPWLLVLDNADDPNTDDQCYFPTALYMSTSPTRQVVGKAGAYISRGHCSIDQYPEVYERPRQRLLRFRPNQARSRYGDVYTTFEASADILHSSKDEAAKDALQLLPILATLSSSRLPLSLFGEAWQGAQWISNDSNGGEGAENKVFDHLTPWHTSQLPQLLQSSVSVWDSFRLLEAMYLLKAFSLVKIETDGGDLNVSSHPLVHAWARDRQSGSEQHQGWLSSACLVICSTVNRGYWLRQVHRLQPHLQALALWPIPIAFAQEPPQLIVTIILACSNQLHHIGDNQSCLALMQQLCAHLGLDATKVDGRWRLLYGCMSEALLVCDQPLQALNVIEQILDLDEQIWSEDKIDRLDAQHTLALAYDDIGNTQRALEILQDVVTTRKHELKQSDRNLLSSQTQLVRIYMRHGRTEDALVLMEQVVQIRERTYDEDDPDRLTSEHELALYHADRGLLKDAHDRIQHVVDVRRRTLPQDHAERLEAERLLARCVWDLGFREQACDLMKHIFNVRREVLNEEDRQLLVSEHTLASYFWELGSRDNAYDLMNDVVKVQQRTLGETPPHRIMAENSLAIYCWELGYRERAYALMQHVVDMRRLTLPAGDESLVQAEGWIHRMKAELEEAAHTRRDDNDSRSSLASNSSKRL